MAATLSARPSRTGRTNAALAALAIEAALILALVFGLAGTIPPGVAPELSVFAVAPPPPPRVERIPPKARTRRPEGAASPPNLRSKATEVVAPKPVVPPPLPSPVVAALVAGTGSAATAGAADRPGPGTGSGGIGDGTGSGGTGDGDGGEETPPRHVGGRLKDSDYPEAAKAELVGGTVSVRYLVGVTGRVSDCRVTRSSGSADLDATTCRLIEQRFRYKPSRDARGRAVPAIIVENHSWIVNDDPTG